MLVISRKENETVTIAPAAGLDPNLTLQQAFALGPIAIKLIRINGSRVRLAIEAPDALKIWRGPSDDAETHVPPPAADTAAGAKRG